MTIGFNEYQGRATATAIYPGQGDLPGLIYAVLGLTNEAGEVAGKMKKALRDDDSLVTSERRQALLDEMGDVLWYMAQVATELGADLADVAGDNLKKLSDRAERNALSGDGDAR